MAADKHRSINSNKIAEDGLCVICGGDSKSLHYGVRSCASCKGFFRRSVRFQHEYICERDNDCEMQGENRIACRACRFAACVRAGMHPKALQEDRGKINCVKRTTPRRRNVLPKLAIPIPVSASVADASQFALARQLAIETTPDLLARPEILNILPTLPFNLLAPAVAKNHAIILNQFWRDQKMMKKGIIGELVASETIGFDEINLLQEQKDLFIAANVKTMLLQMQQCIVELIKVLKAVPGFNHVPHEDKMPLFRNYAPHVSLLMNIMATMPVEGDFLVLMDGLHIIGRNSTPNEMMNSVINEILDELVPRFRELEVDEREFACIRNLAFWNPDIATTADGKEKILREQFIAMMTLRHYIAEKTKNEMSANLRYANILMTLRLVETTGERLRNCLQQMVRDRQIEFNDLLLDILRDPKARPNVHQPTARSDDNAVNAMPEIQDDQQCSSSSWPQQQPYRDLTAERPTYEQPTLTHQSFNNANCWQSPTTRPELGAPDELNQVYCEQPDLASVSTQSVSSECTMSSTGGTDTRKISSLGENEVFEFADDQHCFGFLQIL